MYDVDDDAAAAVDRSQCPELYVKDVMSDSHFPTILLPKRIFIWNSEYCLSNYPHVTTSVAIVSFSYCSFILVSVNRNDISV